jgi:hypothetical protein
MQPNSAAKPPMTPAIAPSMVSPNQQPHSPSGLPRLSLIFRPQALISPIHVIAREMRRPAPLAVSYAERRFFGAAGAFKEGLQAGASGLGGLMHASLKAPD